MFFYLRKAEVFHFRYNEQDVPVDTLLMALPIALPKSKNTEIPRAMAFINEEVVSPPFILSKSSFFKIIYYIL